MECLVYKSGSLYLITLLKLLTVYKPIYVCSAVNLPLRTELLILCLSSNVPVDSCNLSYQQTRPFFWQDPSRG